MNKLNFASLSSFFRVTTYPLSLEIRGSSRTKDSFAAAMPSTQIIPRRETYDTTRTKRESGVKNPRIRLSSRYLLRGLVE